MSVQPPSSLDETMSLSAVPASLVLLQAAKKAKLPVAATLVFPPSLWRQLGVEGINLFTNSTVLHQWYEAYTSLRSDWVRIGVCVSESVRWIAHVTGENGLFQELSTLHSRNRTGEPLWVIVQASPPSIAHGQITTRQPGTGAAGVVRIACWPGEPHAVVDAEEPAEIFVHSTDETVVGESQTSARYQAVTTKLGQLQLAPTKPEFALPQKPLITLATSLALFKRSVPDHLVCHFIYTANKKLLITQISPFYLETSDNLHTLSPIKTQTLLATGSVGELELSGHYQADGVGILRSDYLWSQLNQHPLWLFNRRKRELSAHITEYLQKSKATHPNQRVIYRLLNFNSAELRALQHGKEFEDAEPNPYLGRRGAHWYLTHPDFLTFELETVAKWADKRHAPTGVLIPFVRDSKEWRRIIAHLEKLGCWDNPLFEVWLQLNTPENIAQLQSYLHPKLRGILVHVKTVAALAHGIDPDAASLTIEYTPDYNWLKDTLQTVQAQTQHMPQRLLKYVFAEDPDPSLLELIVQLKYDGVVASPQALSVVRAHLAQFEAAQAVKEQLWQ